MNRFREVIEQFADAAANKRTKASAFENLAAATGEKYETVKGWYRRDFIHSCHWIRVVKAANEAGIAITHEDLASLAEQKQKEGAQ